MLRILIATDLSPNSDLALARAVSLASDHGAALRIVHVTDPRTSEAQRAATRRLLRERWKILASPDQPQAGIALPSGPPAEAIFDEAGDFHADLIVLGAHASMRLRDAWLGTTACHVLRQAEAPVLVVRSDAARPYRRIVAAVEAMTAAEEVLRLASRLASATDVFAVHAFHVPFEAFVGNGTVHDDVEQEHRRALESLIGNVAPAVGSVRFHARIEEGDVLPAIAEAVNDLNPDLLVLGTHGRRGLAAALFDSVAEAALAHFELDMLVVRTAAGESLLEM